MVSRDELDEKEQNHAIRISRYRRQDAVLCPARLLRPGDLLCTDGLLRPDRLLHPGSLLRANGLLHPIATEGRLR